MPLARPRSPSCGVRSKRCAVSSRLRASFVKIVNRLDRLRRALRQVCKRCERAAAVARVRTAAATCCRSVDWGRWRIDSASSCGRVRAILESGDHLKALRRRGRAGYRSRGESDASGIMAYRRAAGVPASSMRQLNSSSRWRCLPRSLRANRWRRAWPSSPGIGGAGRELHQLAQGGPRGTHSRVARFLTAEMTAACMCSR